MELLIRLGTYFTTILISLYSVFFVIPELHFNHDGLTSITKTLKDIENKSYKYTESKWFNTGIGNGRRLEYRDRTGYTTIYKMTDDSEYNITGHHPKYNGAIISRDNVGKTIKIYTEKESTIPLQLEIDNKIIFGIKESNNTKYLVLGFTFALIIYSILVWNKVVKEE